MLEGQKIKIIDEKHPKYGHEGQIIRSLSEHVFLIQVYSCKCKYEITLFQVEIIE